MDSNICIQKGRKSTSCRGLSVWGQSLQQSGGWGTQANQSFAVGTNAEKPDWKTGIATPQRFQTKLNQGFPGVFLVVSFGMYSSFGLSQNSNSLERCTTNLAGDVCSGQKAPCAFNQGGFFNFSKVEKSCAAWRKDFFDTLKCRPCCACNMGGILFQLQ